jgi:hypothetical protein
MRGRLPFIASTLALVAACSPKNNGTLLVAHVDTDFSVPAELNRIEIRIVPQHGGGTTDSFPLGGPGDLPVTLAIRPSGDPAFSIDITAIGSLGATEKVSQTATVAFTPGEAREFTLVLSRDCARAMPCPAATDVCLKGGACVSKTQVAQTQPYVPRADGGVDAPKDGGNVFDAGNRDARPNPGQWVLANPPFPATSANLYGVWPIDDATVWVVGSVQSRGIAARFAQGQWAEAVLPAGTPTLFGVWASGAADVWAVGSMGTVIHSDGNAWTPVSISGGPAPTENLAAVWGASSSEVWIVGNGGVILRGSANSVARETSNTVDNLVSVWGTTASEVWALTAFGAVLRRTNAWAVQSPNLAAHIFYGIWLSSRTDVWVVGQNATLHNDGSAWATAPNPLDSAISVWGSASDDIWAVGGPMPPSTTYISRFNGVQWMTVPTPSTMPLQAVRGTSATNVWAAGNSGTVLRLQSP